MLMLLSILMPLRCRRQLPYFRTFFFFFFRFHYFLLSLFSRFLSSAYFDAHASLMLIFRHYGRFSICRHTLLRFFHYAAAAFSPFSLFVHADSC